MTPKGRARRRRPVVFVSSTVYGIEELLDRLFGLLTDLGYVVWMSHKGTVPVSSERHAFEDCLAAVERCDLFLGLITPRYGSGREPGADMPSITHLELLKAIELQKPRWVLAHDHVVFARALLRDLGYPTKERRRTLAPGLKRGASSVDDLRVIDMYEDATQNDVEFEARRGNWVQKFDAESQAALFVQAQFSRYQEAEAFVRENFPALTGRARRT